ncbi:hypothetical protein CY34DRAFT_227201 [Suillus luteus UH-Slu-Lm8-n1]|uniref:Uncharacterized protein n=1 Tax=Suillus luteus UH-Slu-Lm8-n1 TaxID=930992 RepID=A0A0D0AC50_9AGAM|nr:hypothetical protein CY34DRAFT_227201 [Suillus luteus UH-Slu-Lm8-n1]
MFFAAQLHCCVYETHRSATGAVCCASSSIFELQHTPGVPVSTMSFSTIDVWEGRQADSWVLIGIQYRIRETSRLSCIIDVENG